MASVVAPDGCAAVPAGGEGCAAVPAGPAGTWAGHHAATAIIAMATAHEASTTVPARNVPCAIRYR
jgi:hypothetical protein